MRTKYSGAPRTRSERARSRGGSSRIARRSKIKIVRRLPLGSLRVFLAVAQNLNFTRAADQLGVTAGAASLQIKALEEYLGKPLLRRDGRGVELTTEGSALLPRVAQALDDLEQALDDTRAPRGTGALRLSLFASFLNKWLTPRLGDFARQHPGIRLTLLASNDVVDFVRSEHDAAIRMGLGTWTALEREKILDEYLVPVCVPALLKRHGPVDDTDRLTRYPLLHSVHEPWELWQHRNHVVDEDYSPPGRETVFEDSAAVIVAAKLGRGLALARWSLVADEVAGGQVVVAARHALPYQRAYWFVYPKRSRALASIAAFRDWFKHQAATFPKPPGVTS